MDRLTILQGDVIEQLQTLPDNSVHCCITSPPYWGLRDYGVAGQIGLEPTFAEYLAKIVGVFAEVRRVLRPDGTLWLNAGDAHYAPDKWGGGKTNTGMQTIAADGTCPQSTVRRKKKKLAINLKSKDLMMQPARIAIALQDAGWYLRQDIIWHKPNPMPESVTDRPTTAHDHIFLLAKSERYFYDAENVKEPTTGNAHSRGQGLHRKTLADDERRIKANARFARHTSDFVETRNCRSVWSIHTRAFAGAHFATFPPEIPRRCILAGTSSYGVCVHCGAPYARVIEKTKGDAPASWNGSSFTRNRREASGGLFDEPGAGLRTVKVETIGWQRPCRCPESDQTARAVVLDPFGGSGTTGAVALEMGRDAIMVELNPTYIEIIKRRCQVTYGLRLVG